MGVCPFCSNLRFMRAYYDKNKPQIYELLRKQYDKNSWKKDDSPKDIWKKEGCSRSFDNAEYDLPEEDFFSNEKTELPEEEEIFSGLSEEEKNEILKETGLLEGEDGRE